MSVDINMAALPPPRTLYIVWLGRVLVRAFHVLNLPRILINKEESDFRLCGHQITMRVILGLGYDVHMAADKLIIGIQIIQHERIFVLCIIITSTPADYFLDIGISRPVREFVIIEVPFTPASVLIPYQGDVPDISLNILPLIRFICLL